MSFFHWGAQNWTQHSGSITLTQTMGEGLPSSSCWQCSSQGNSGCHDVVGYLCKRTLLVHGQLLVHQDLHVFLCKAAFHLVSPKEHWWPPNTSADPCISYVELHEVLVFSFFLACRCLSEWWHNYLAYQLLFPILYHLQIYSVYTVSHAGGGKKKFKKNPYCYKVKRVACLYQKESWTLSF